MTTESTAINYKIGNERLISVTETAARKLESLLEEKGRARGGATSRSGRRRMLRLAIRHGFGGWPERARYSRADLECAVGCRSKKRAFCQRLRARL